MKIFIFYLAVPTTSPRGTSSHICVSWGCQDQHRAATDDSGWEDGSLNQPTGC